MSKQITPIENIRGSLQRMSPEFKKALPAHIPVERFLRVAQTAITTNPTLMNCSKQSLFAACTRAAELGLLPDGIQGAIVPYKNDAKFMSMIAGKMKLARNSGEIQTLDSQVIYKNDEFAYFITEEGPRLKFQPNLLGDRGKVVGAFAMGITKDGGVYIEVMSNEQIKAIEGASRGKGGPWNGPFRDEMVRKSVMNRLLKRMPTSTDLDMDIENDYAAVDPATVEPDFEIPVEKSVEVVEKDVTKPNKLAELMESEDSDSEDVPL